MNEKYPLALPEGTILAGQYIIEEVLGQGGFGITYRALDHKSGEKVDRRTTDMPKKRLG